MVFDSIEYKERKRERDTIGLRTKVRGHLLRDQKRCVLEFLKTEDETEVQSLKQLHLYFKEYLEHIIMSFKDFLKVCDFPFVIFTFFCFAG